MLRIVQPRKSKSTTCWPCAERDTLVYELDDELSPTVPGGRYLDPDAAEAAAAAVASQGR